MNIKRFEGPLETPRHVLVEIGRQGSFYRFRREVVFQANRHRRRMKSKLKIMASRIERCTFRNLRLCFREMSIHKEPTAPSILNSRFLLPLFSFSLSPSQSFLLSVSLALAPSLNLLCPYFRIFRIKVLYTAYKTTR